MELSTLLLFCTAAFAVAAVMVAAGFGLGTTLTPLFLFVYDVKTAVFLVAIVHFANGMFRLALFRTHVDRRLVVRFGLLAVVGGVTGSVLQKHVANPALEAGLGVLLVVLGGVALVPVRAGWRFPPRLDPLGGFLSGLLGGLIGNQGALRSGYLLNYALPKEAFIATGTSIACLVDVSRIPVYLYNYHADLSGAWPYLTVVIVAAWSGTFAGKRLVEKLSTRWFRTLVAVLLVLTGIALVFANW